MYHDGLAKLSKDELIALGLAPGGADRGIDPAYRRTRGQAGRTTQDPGQLVNTTLANAQAQPCRAPRGEKAQGPPWRVSSARPRPGPDRFECCRTLPALRTHAEPGRSGWLSCL